MKLGIGKAVDSDKKSYILQFGKSWNFGGNTGSYAPTLIKTWSQINVTLGLSICKRV